MFDNNTGADHQMSFEFDDVSNVSVAVLRV